MSRLQPEIEPVSPTVSSMTYRFQVPLGLVSLKTESEGEPYGPAGVVAGNDEGAMQLEFCVP